MIAPALLQTQAANGALWRIVENQEQAATRAITDSAPEQARLEELLDANKPAYLPGSEQLHWLLKSPFRYPPLRHGSRFGTHLRPGILYGARELPTAMTESAVYLWLFRAGPLDTGPLATLRDSRTALHFRVRHRHCADLTGPDAVPWQAQISDPASYRFSQPLGDALRESGAAVIWFYSARRPGGCNAAVLSPTALPARTPPAQQHWQLQLDARHCWWGRAGEDAIEIDFDSVATIEGRIPHPAL